MKIEIFGTGCPKCQAVERNVHRALKELGLEDRAQVLDVRDPKEMAARGVIFTPALFIDGKKVSEGKVPSVGEIIKLIGERQK
jgi:small redox-active disulfide protein 2